MTIKEVSTLYGLTEDTLRYYERVGVVPSVARTAGGRRDYTEEDTAWVELACCLRSASLPVAVIAEYVRLTQQGDGTIGARLELLEGQREKLLLQRRKLDAALERLDYKIERYREAEQTGELTWGECE
ncbi:MAG: MerR family transcriptional regulator [Oscillospiraceae bacterium]|nr:MerR family transcriptional regulator [Oscillospiraceae bacterium]